jgi:hypothetical protein
VTPILFARASGPACPAVPEFHKNSLIHAPTRGRSARPVTCD